MKRKMRFNQAPGRARPLVGAAARGGAMVEYVILVGLITIGGISTVMATGMEIKDLFDTSTEAISTPTTPGTPTEDVAEESCVDVPDDQDFHASTTWPTAPCFTFRQEVGDTYFAFAGSDTRLIYTSGAADAGANYMDEGMWPAEIYGDSADNTMIIDGTPTQIGFDGLDGYDRIIAQGVNFSDVTVDTSTYNLQLYTPMAGSPPARAMDLFIYDCGVEAIVFDDGVYSIDQILAAETPPDPLRPGPSGYPGYGCSYPEPVDDPSDRPGDPTDTPAYKITENCLGDASGRALWCVGDPERPGDPTNGPFTETVGDCIADASGLPAWCIGDPERPGDPTDTPYDLTTNAVYDDVELPPGYEPYPGYVAPEGPVPLDVWEIVGCVTDASGSPLWCRGDDINDLPPDLEIKSVEDEEDPYWQMSCVYRPSTSSFIGDWSTKVCMYYDRYIATDNCVVDRNNSSDHADWDYVWCPATELQPLPSGLTWRAPPVSPGDLCAYDTSWNVFVSGFEASSNPPHTGGLACQ